MAVIASTMIAGWACDVQADILVSPPNGFTAVEELGVLSLNRTYGARPGEACVHDETPKGCRILAIAAEWSPSDVPIMVSVERSSRGYAFLLSTRLRDRKGFPVCFFRRSLGSATTSTAARMWAGLTSDFDTWTKGCDVVRELGVDRTRMAFVSIQSDMERAYKALKAAPQLPISEEDASLDSFFPAKVTQPLLNAVAIACDGAPGFPKLESDGAIAWRFDQSIAYGADGSRPFGVCVDEQIRYFPGYQNHK
jgi:hypothetical protein